MQQQNPHNPQQPQQPQQVMMPTMVPPMVPPQGASVPPPMMRQNGRGRRTWRERLLGNANARPMTVQQERTIPNWLAGKSMVFFFVAMASCWVAFAHVPALELWLVASLSVVLFFYGSQTMLNKWSHSEEKRFLMNIYWVGVIIRIIFVSYMFYYFNPEHYDTTYGDTADVTWYMPFGKAIADWLTGDSHFTFSQLQETWNAAIDDVGYPFWLAIVYIVSFGQSDVFMPFVIKSIVGAYCAICIYHVAKRHFGAGTARLAALFVALNPNMIYWCAMMMKEAEMVFLVCLAVDNLDKVLSSGNKLTFKALLPGMLAALALMFFRTVLGLVLFLSVFAHIVMASNRVMSLGKKIIAGVLVAAVLTVAMGDRIQTQSQKLVVTAQSDWQQRNMEWRAEREDGNSFAKFAGAAVFAPLIFTIPFPTFNDALGYQYTQMILSGGSYIKNVFSFFVLLVMFLLLISGEWRRHVFILAYTCGYLVVLVMSSFAHSGRFHMPIWPMLMLFAAYGIQIAKGNKRVQRGFTLALIAEVFVCLAWNWFKLKGRGMI